MMMRQARVGSQTGVGFPAVLGAVAGALVAMVLPLLLPGGLPAASAHDSLTSSDPASEEVLEESPEQVRLEYSAELLDLSTAVRLSNSDGEEVTVSDPVVDGAVVTVDVPPLAAGDYEMQWRVVSSDGHPIDGTLPFTIEETSTAQAAPGAEQTAPAATQTATAAADAAEEQAAVEQQDNGIPWTALILGGLALLLVVGMIVLAATRKWRTPST